MPNIAPDPITGEKKYSMQKAAVKKRRNRERKKIAKFAEQIESARQTILHETKVVSADNAGPDQFAALPDIAPSEPAPQPAQPVEGEATEPGSAQPDPAQAAPPSPVGTTPEEAKLFGAALVWYFQLGTGALLAKDPRAQQMAGAVLQGIPRPPGSPPLAPEQAMAALCQFVAGCGERVAMKYNLRIPYLDEAVVVGVIGFSTWGLVYNPEKVRAKKAKDANPTADKPADADKPDPQKTNGHNPRPRDPNEVQFQPGAPGIDLDAEVTS